MTVKPVLEFKLINNDLASNKEQLVSGFKLLNTELDVEKLIENKTIRNFFAFIKKFKSESTAANQNKTEISEFFLQHHFHHVLLRFGDYFSAKENMRK